jgi:hypothetical protein
MSEIIDLGSPDRELSAGDIKRKQKKLERTTERLKNTPTGTRKRHRLEFKQLKTEAQIKTGMSGIHVDKKPFKVSHQYDLQQDDDYYGVSRKSSALNMLGISRKSSPLNDMTELENNITASGIDPKEYFAKKAWDKFSKGYTDRKVKFEGRPNERPLTHEENIKERNRESHEFYYDTSGKRFADYKIKGIPTNDADLPVKGFKEKLKPWQISPFKNPPKSYTIRKRGMNIT